jgi:hypothetical protein
MEPTTMTKAIRLLTLGLLALSSGCVYVQANVAQVESAALDLQFPGLGVLAGQEMNVSKTFTLGALDPKIVELVTSANIQRITLVPRSTNALDFMHQIDLGARSADSGVLQPIATRDPATTPRAPDGSISVTVLPGVDSLSIVKSNPTFELSVDVKALAQDWSIDVHVIYDVSAAQTFSL